MQTTMGDTAAKEKAPEGMRWHPMDTNSTHVKDKKTNTSKKSLTHSYQPYGEDLKAVKELDQFVRVTTARRLVNQAMGKQLYTDKGRAQAKEALLRIGQDDESPYSHARRFAGVWVKMSTIQYTLDFAIATCSYPVGSASSENSLVTSITNNMRDLNGLLYKETELVTQKTFETEHNASWLANP